jgi:hypothetical protein
MAWHCTSTKVLKIVVMGTPIKVKQLCEPQIRKNLENAQLNFNIRIT